jgi:hypothetical protein
MIAPHRLKELFNIVLNYVTTCTLKQSLFLQVVRSGHIIAHYVNIAIAIRGAPLFLLQVQLQRNQAIKYDGNTALERSGFGRALKTGGVWQIPINSIHAFAKRQDLKPWIYLRGTSLNNGQRLDFEGLWRHGTAP